MDLQQATEQLIQAFQQGNPRLEQVTEFQPATFAGRRGLAARLQNVSDATGNAETIVLTTAMTDEGTLFYSIGVAPSSEFSQYARTLQQVNASVALKR